MVLHGLQPLLGRLYDVELDYDVYDFLVTDRRCLPAAAPASLTDEELIVAQPEEGGDGAVAMSLYLDPEVLEDLGGPRPSTSYKGFNYDLGAQKPITFDALFAPNSKPLDSIYPIVQREVGRQTGFGAAILPGSGLDSSHYQNFAITDDELIFYFAPGELLPSLAGASQVHVPRNAIPPLTVKG